MLVQASTRSALDKSEQLQMLAPRRRDFLTFITWPFFLSETFKSVQAFGGLAHANDEEGTARATAPEQAAAYPQLVDDEPISRPSLEPSPTQSSNLAPADLPIQLSDDPSSLSGNGLALAKPSGEPQTGGGTASAGAGDDVGPGSGAGLPDVQATESGADISTALSSQPIDLEISTDLPSLDLSLKLGPVSLDIATGDTIGAALSTPVSSTFGGVAEPVLETIADGVVSTLRELSGPLHNLLDGSVLSSGILDLVDVGRPAPSFEILAPAGTYNDYDVALRADGATGSPGPGISADIAGHQIDAHIAWHASATASEATVTPSPLHSMADELTLRGISELAL